MISSAWIVVRPPISGVPVPGAKAGVEAVDVEGEVDRAVAHLRADLRHQRRQRLVPALLGLHDAEALAARPVEIVGGIAGAAQADLDAALGVEQPFLDRAAERRAVGDRLAEHVLVDVGMGIDMDKPDRPVLLRDRAQDRIGDGVVAAERQRDAVLGEDARRRRR